MEHENNQTLPGKSRPSQSPEPGVNASPPQQSRKLAESDHEDDEDDMNEAIREKNIGEAHPDATSRDDARSDHEDLAAADEDAPLEIFDWKDLGSRFIDEMNAQTQEEERIQAEFRKLMDFYMIWQQTPVLQEQERCSKRLRTRIAYVEMREKDLEGKRLHHTQVQKAFQSALELLKQQFRP